MLKSIAITIIASFFIVVSSAQTGVVSKIGVWKQAPCKLPTRWTALVNSENVLPEYPRPQMVRGNWQNLNGLWDYVVTDSSDAQPLRYKGKILVPYPIESALSGVNGRLLPNQQLWYHRSFSINKKLQDKKYLLHFGAVDFLAKVYVNKKEIGKHQGGYQNFSLDITDALKDGSNDILISVFDPSDKGINPHGKQVLNPQGIMYTAVSGIWQTVWIETVPKVFIESIKLIPDIDKEQLQVLVATNLNKPEYSVEIYSNGKRATGKVGTPFTFPVPNPRLWSPDNPFLYNISIRLVNNGRVIDTIGSYFGMRKIEIKEDPAGISRIYLNNKYTFNLGLLDQGYWPDGIYTAPTDEALQFDIEVTKKMGFNTIRKHIKIEPDRWYYHCDRLGILIWQDMPNPSYLGMESKKQFEAEIDKNIDQLYNHPSIICWVLFNEGWNRYDQERLTSWMKQKDPSRIINGHSGENYDRGAPKDVSRKWIASDLTDIHDYPGPGIAPRLAGKARVIGEWGGVRVATSHQWDSTNSWGYIETTPSDFVTKYNFMIKHLQVFEEEGLTASIFTQTTDVEIEENGILTYDRELFKIPIDEIRKINERILKSPILLPK